MDSDAGTKLRALEVGDLPFTRRWRALPEVVNGALCRQFPVTEADEDAWFRQLAQGQFPTSITWAVSNADNAIVGLSSLVHVNWIHRTAEFGIWIAPEEWGSGHGTRATTLTLKHAFEALGLRQVRLHVLASNQRALALYKGIGFQQEGVLADAVLVDGAFCDVMLLRLDADTFRAMQAKS